jgi:hypothetical protein
MRTSQIQWHTHRELPAAGRLVVFEFGEGLVVGTFYAGFFLSAHKRSIDRVLVNRWRYCDADRREVKFAA